MVPPRPTSRWRFVRCAAAGRLPGAEAHGVVAPPHIGVDERSGDPARTAREGSNLEGAPRDACRWRPEAEGLAGDEAQAGVVARIAFEEHQGLVPAGELV